MLALLSLNWFPFYKISQLEWSSQKIFLLKYQAAAFIIPDLNYLYFSLLSFAALYLA